MSDVFATRIAALKSIGSAIRKSDTLAAEIVASLPENFDASVSGAIPGAIHLFATGCACPSGRGKTCQCGARPAVKIKGEATVYGQGVDTVGKAVRALLGGNDAKPAVLRVSMSGEGGGSTVVPADHPLYDALVELLGASAEA